MNKFRSWTTISIAVGTFAGTSSASPWPIEASIAYVEELQLACAKAQPAGKAKFQARKELLYSESPERVKQAMASPNYSQARNWARDTLGHSTTEALIAECSDFLTHSNLALKQPDQRMEDPVPTSQ